MHNMLSFLGILTVLVSFVGVIVSYVIAQRFRSLEDEVAQRLYHLFMSDSLFFFITLGFGVATFSGIQADFILYPARIAIIALNIFYSYRLVAKLRWKK